jgi:hypothetical protein
MKNQKVLLPLIFSCALMFLCSCTSVGTKFSPPDPDKLQFGKLQASDAIALFGKPDGTVRKMTSDGNLKVYKYAYALVNFGVASERVLLLEFKEEKLNAYFNWSSFREDKTTFDPATVDKLKAGIAKLTKNEVTALVGKPDGKALCPSTITCFKDHCDKNTEVWGWYMKDNLNFWRPPNVKVTELFVSFDANGTISDVETDETTNP